MPENNTEGRICPSCGATVDGAHDFCTKCGTKLTAQASEPVGVIDPFDISPASSAPAKCAKCGADIKPDTAFCTVCGEPVTASASSAAPAPEFCTKCGAKLESGSAFCTACGTLVDGGSSEDIVAKKVKKKRKISLILYLIGVGIAGLFGFIFFCTPFMKISVYGTEITKQSGGFGIIGMMFGGTGLITSLGVKAELLRWAGWLYLVFILGLFESLACISMNSKGFKKGERPFGVLSGVSAMFVAALGILILSLTAKNGVMNALIKEMGTEGASGSVGMLASVLDFYLGGILLFVFVLIGFGLCLFAVIYSYGTYEKGKRKIVGLRRWFLVVDIALAVILAACAVLVVVNPFKTKEYHVAPGDSGTATIKCRDEFSVTGVSMYFGVVIFVPEDMEDGKDYKFIIDTDFGLSAADMEDTICLCYYDDIAGEDTMKIYELLSNGESLATNQVSKKDHAELTFNNNYNDKLAIIVGFAATGKVTDEFDYKFVEV